VRRRTGTVSSFASNPTLVGAVTTLIITVAVFLAYNANHGLPFVSTYRVSVVVPDAASLVPGNDVRIGGVQVGTVESVEPQQRSNGSVDAKIDVKLEGSVNPLPVDSSVIVRAKSALGLKYLEIDKGTSAKGYPPGAVLPLSAAHPEPVDIDQLLNTFNTPTRDAIRQNLTQFGTALGGRGVDLNEAIGELRPLLVRLEPVARNLSSPQTGLARFVDALAATAAEVAPVAETQAHLFVSLDTTFGALASVARPFIQETISKSPPAEDVAIHALPQIRPFLSDSALLFHDLQPGAEALRTSSPILARALGVGIPALRASPQLNAQLPPTAQALYDLNNNASARKGIGRLTKTNELLKPLLAFVTPAQSVCNYGTLLFGNAASAEAFGNGSGNFQRFNLLQAPFGPNNEGSPSKHAANGGGPAPDANYLHVNPYPNTASPGQTHECEAGNETYIAGKQEIGNVPGNQGTKTAGQG
jgi:phospholipid/cholesterol/gamma-HCH transport system substrate-binding protein